MRLSTIEKKVNKLAKNWVGEKHIPSIIRQLNKEFARYIIYFKSCRYDQRFYEDHAVIVSAHYCPRISLGIPENIIVTLHFPVENKKAKISPACAQNMAMKIIRAIHHEYRHQYQQRLRGFSNTKEYQTKDTDKNPERLQYFGNPHEIDAHAYETQAEKFNINKLRKAHKISWRESEAVYMYRRHFRERDPKIWKKFLKKVYKNNGIKNIIHC